MRTVLVTCFVLLLTAAWAWQMPADAQVVLTAEDGRIVGVGFALDGERFELELLPSFEGPAQLLVMSLEGGALALRVIVADAVVYVDTASLHDPADGDEGHGGEPLERMALTALLEASGFARVAVGPRDGTGADPSVAGDRPRGADAAAAAAAGSARPDDAGAAAPGNAADGGGPGANERPGSARDADDDTRGATGAEEGPPAHDERPGAPPAGRP